MKSPYNAPVVRSFLIFLLLASLSALAQRPPLPQTDAMEAFSFEHYGQTEGLSQGTINDMVSFDGFMWFATQDGLNRFDGVDFKVFRKGGAYSLANNLVESLLADSKGRLWIGTGGGVDLYDPKSGKIQPFQHVFGLKHPVGKAAIHQIFEDKQGRIWLMTNALGLFCFDPLTKAIDAFFRNDNTIQGSCVAQDGRIWVFTFNDVFLFDAKAGLFRPMHLQQQLRMQSLIRNILIDQEDNLWVATSDDGAFKINRSKIVHYQQGNTTRNLTSNDVATMIGDRDGRVWLGTRTGGICIYHPETGLFTYARHSRNTPRSLTEDFVWQLYQDNQGIIWVGNSSQGVDKYDPHRFPFGLIRQTADDPRQSLPDNMIFRLFGQGQDLYIGTETGGSARYSLANHHLTASPPRNSALSQRHAQRNAGDRSRFRQKALVCQLARTGSI